MQSVDSFPRCRALDTVPGEAPYSMGRSEPNFLAFLNPDLLQLLFNGPHTEHLPHFLRGWPQAQRLRPFRKFRWFSEGSDGRSHSQKNLNEYIEAALVKQPRIVTLSKITLGPLTAGRRLGHTLKQSLKPKVYFSLESSVKKHKKKQSEWKIVYVIGEYQVRSRGQFSDGSVCASG